MANDSPNTKNLIPLNKRTKDDIQKITSMGGIASAKARRLKKQYSETTVVKRHEIEFFDDLDIILTAVGNDVKVIRQYAVGKYRVDGYINTLNIVIEYDEEQHCRKKTALSDNKRQQEINVIIRPTWIRVLKGNEIEGFRDIIHEVLRKRER